METSQEADFEAFVGQRAHALLKTAYALTGDRHAAEDLVQDGVGQGVRPVAGTSASQRPTSGK